MDILTLALAKKYADSVGHPTAEEIGTAVSDYLEDHPVEAGATTVEHAQIYQNKTDITNLASRTDVYEHDNLSNFFKPSTDFAGNGYIGADGEPISYEGMRYTKYIALKANTVYYSPDEEGNFYSRYYAFYNSNKELIASYDTLGTLGHPFTTPAGTAYARFTMLDDVDVNKAYISTFNDKPPAYRNTIKDSANIYISEGKYCDYSGDDIRVFNKILCIGDSLTEGIFNRRDQGYDQGVYLPQYSYPTLLNKMTGVTVVNKGHSGETSAQWYAHEQSSDLSGYDCAIIQLGANDADNGGWTQSSITAFTNIINKLKTQNKNIKIFVATMIPAFSYSGSTYNAVSQGIRALVSGLADENVILLDMAVYGHTLDSMAFNAGHLSAYGYYRLAKDYKSYISYIMSTNKMDFREIQFIGTDYWYES